MIHSTPTADVAANAFVCISVLVISFCLRRCSHLPEPAAGTHVVVLIIVVATDANANDDSTADDSTVADSNAVVTIVAVAASNDVFATVVAASFITAANADADDSTAAQLRPTIPKPEG